MSIQYRQASKEAACMRSHSFSYRFGEDISPYQDEFSATVRLNTGLSGPVSGSQQK